MDSKKEAKHKQRSNTSKSTTSATSRLSQTSASSHHGSLRRSSSSSNLDPRRYREQKNPEPKSPSPASTSAQEISPPASPGTHLAQLLQRSAISDRSRSPSRSGSRQATTHDSSAQRRHHSTRSKSPAPGDRSGRKSKDFTLLEAASSPLLTLRKGAQPDGSRTTTHSSTRLKKHLHRWTGNAQKQQKQQQQQEKEENVETSQDETANSSDKSLTCPTCGTQLPSRDSYKKQYVNPPFLARYLLQFPLPTHQHDAYVFHGLLLHK